MSQNIELSTPKPETSEMHENMFKEMTPTINYNDLETLLGQISLEMTNFDELLKAVIDNAIDKKEDMFPACIGLLKRYHLIEKLHLEVVNAKPQEEYARYVLMRIFLAALMAVIFEICLYKEAGELKPLRPFYMLYATCYMKFNSPKFHFPDDFIHEFAFMEEYVSSINPCLGEPFFKKSLFKASAQDVIDIIKVFIDGLKTIKKRSYAQKKDTDTLKYTYPYVSFMYEPKQQSN
jgi:hypothetical protein